ncbi:MAG: hypothetical protein WAN93_14100 [Solirubrobacteraceae bacterium]
MTAPAHRTRSIERWLWTGPIGHLVGGGLDFAEALARYLRARRLSRTPR